MTAITAVREAICAMRLGNRLELFAFGTGRAELERRGLEARETSRIGP